MPLGMMEASIEALKPLGVILPRWCSERFQGDIMMPRDTSLSEGFSYYTHRENGPVPNKDLQTTPCRQLPFSWKMRNVLKRLKNQFSDFHFFKLSWKFIENWQFSVKKWPKNDHNSKIKKRKISIQRIPHLSCKSDHIWFFFFGIPPCMQKTDEIIAKYAIDANLFRLGSSIPPKKIQGLKKKIHIFFNI